MKRTNPTTTTTKQFDNILAIARRRAKERKEELFIVNDDGYKISTDQELETFFNGCKVLAAIDADGSVSYS